MDILFMLLGAVMVALFIGILPLFTAGTRWDGTGSVHFYAKREWHTLPAWETGRRIRSAIMWGVYALALEAVGCWGMLFFLNASLQPMNTLATVGTVFGAFVSLAVPIGGITWLCDNARQRP